MKLGDKLAIAKRAIESITKHDDEDKEVREAALSALEAFMASERAAIDARVKARLCELGLSQPAGA